MKVYQHACLVTVNENFDVIEDGTLAVDGARIAYAGPYRAYPEDDETDVSGHVIMPGFVNGHNHMPMVMFRGFADDMSLHVWLNERIFPLEMNHTDQTQYHGALLAAAEMTRTGTTTVNDMYLNGFITARALKEAGLSGIVTTCLMTLYPDRKEKEAACLELWKTYRDDPDIRTAIGPHAEYTSCEEDLAHWSDVAYETGQPIHTHCSETVSEHRECIERHGLTPVAFFEKIGYYRVPTLLAHCVHVTEEDMDIIRDNGASVLHNPCSNLKLASGIAPIPRMLEKGLKIAVSTDGASSNNTLDIWEEMRLTALIHKGYNQDPLAVSARTALELSTRRAAEALGFTDRGSLEAGKRADFLVVSRKEPALQIPTNIVNLLVYSGNSRDIVMTVAGGEVLYDHGVYTKLDTEAIYAHAREDFETVFRHV